MYNIFITYLAKYVIKKGYVTMLRNHTIITTKQNVDMLRFSWNNSVKKYSIKTN